MGKAIKKVVGAVTGGLTEKVKPTIADSSYFDISKEAAPAQAAYADVLKQSQALNTAAQPAQTAALTQMGDAVLGKGPSLAQVQLKAAQDRNLAQQLAAVQAGRGSSAALNQRALLQNMASSGRGLAQDSAAARLQERDSFLNQANLAQQAVRNDITGKLNIDVMPKQAMQNWEMQRVGAVNQAQQANAASQNAMTGALIGGAATVAGGYFGGKAGGGQVSQIAGSKFGSQAMPFADGGSVTHEYKKGGKVKGPGTETSDSIPTMLSNKEFVIKASVAKKPGMLALLEKINSGKVEKKDLSRLAKALASKKSKKAD